MKKLFKIGTFSLLLIIVSLLAHCQSCNNETIGPENIKTTSAAFYNLEAIDLPINDQLHLSFSFNGKELKLENTSKLYISDDLIVYRTKEGKWRATVIGSGGIESTLEIKSQNNLIKEIHIKTTSEISPYKDDLGPEWPGLENVGNTCFANSVYKVIARSSGFDEVLNQDEPGKIHTYLRNIVNGIRLGKRSALNEEAINREISKILLNALNIQTGRTWNDGNPHDSKLLLSSIVNRIFPEPYLLSLQDLAAVIDEVNTRHAREYVYADRNWMNDELFDKRKYFLMSSPSRWISSHAIKGELKPQNIGYSLTPPRSLFFELTDAVKAKDVPEIIQLPIWDYQTKKQLVTKTYRAVAMSISGDGHAWSLIKFNQGGWVKHDDLQATKLSKLASSDDAVQMIVYELQN